MTNTARLFLATALLCAWGAVRGADIGGADVGGADILVGVSIGTTVGSADIAGSQNSVESAKLRFPVGVSPSITASEAFVRMPATTLDLLNSSMRRDMLDYLKADSVYNVMNTMEGFSHLNAPLTDNYLQVQVTPVSRFTVKILPAKKGNIVMTLYTVGDADSATDSELRFYDDSLNELPRDKFIKLASTDDFLDLKGVDGKTRKELRSIVPFPTVDYTVSPDGNTMKAELTVGEFIGKEDMERLAPYLHRERTYIWNGKKWTLHPM